MPYPELLAKHGSEFPWARIISRAHEQSHNHIRAVEAQRLRANPHGGNENECLFSSYSTRSRCCFTDIEDEPSEHSFETHGGMVGSDVTESDDDDVFIDDPDDAGGQAMGGDPEAKHEAHPPSPEPVLTLRCSTPAFGKRSRNPRMATAKFSYLPTSAPC
eukprot:PhM_4_TR3090/c4_g1_i3/m.106842